MIVNSQEVSNSVHALRSDVDEQNRQFMATFEEVNQKFADELLKQRQSISQAFLEIQQNRVTLTEHFETIKDIQFKASQLTARVEKQEVITKDLTELKCDTSYFNDTFKETWE